MAEKRNWTPRNPFVYQGYISPKYFCDRTEETEELTANLQNGRNTVLISPRRIGKTGLIKNTFYHINEQEKDAKCIYIDIFATKNQHDFVQLLGTAIAQEMMSKEKQALKRLMEFFGSWRPVFSTDPYTGTPTVTVSIEPAQTEVTLKQIFDYLGNSKHETYVAIDEFQQISNYPDTGIEALLRSYIQFVPNVHFVFAGSKRHLMSQIFHSPDRPFYQSTVTMGLDPLHEEIYHQFANRFFEDKKGTISQEMFHNIYQQMGGVTRNIQLMLNRLYETERSVTTEAQVDEAVRYIVNRNALQYEELITFFTDNQLAIAKAIAKEGTVATPQSSEFIRCHNLPSASSIRTALEALTDKDIVMRTPSGYRIYDRFLEIWLCRL